MPTVPPPTRVGFSYDVALPVPRFDIPRQSDVTVCLWAEPRIMQVGELNFIKCIFHVAYLFRQSMKI